jgi:GNAT superfamily N-acetyltransferase
MGELTLRLATRGDMPVMAVLMEASIRRLLGAVLTPEQVEGSFETMGIDTQLIDDGTYFVVEDGSTMVGCGGWSRRATLFGGNHTEGRDDSLLDPATGAARIRAMYTHPDHARRGIGRMIIEAAEAAACAEGFQRSTLGATLGGLPLYRAVGYHTVEERPKPAKNGSVVTLFVMEKALREGN